MLNKKCQQVFSFFSFTPGPYVSQWQTRPSAVGDVEMDGTISGSLRTSHLTPCPACLSHVKLVLEIPTWLMKELWKLAWKPGWALQPVGVS